MSDDQNTKSAPNAAPEEKLEGDFGKWRLHLTLISPSGIDDTYITAGSESELRRKFEALKGNG